MEREAAAVGAGVVLGNLLQLFLVNLYMCNRKSESQRVALETSSCKPSTHYKCSHVTNLAVLSCLARVPIQARCYRSVHPVYKSLCTSACAALLIRPPNRVRPALSHVSGIHREAASGGEGFECTVAALGHEPLRHPSAFNYLNLIFYSLWLFCRCLEAAAGLITFFQLIVWTTNITYSRRRKEYVPIFEPYKICCSSVNNLKEEGASGS